MRKNTPLARIAAVLAAALLSLAALGSLTACQNEAQVLEEQLCSELDQIKDASDENLTELLGAEVIEEIKSYGIDPHEIYAALLGRFDYVSKGVVIDGDSATATLDVTNIDVAYATQSYMDAIEAWASSEEALQLIVADDQSAFEARIVQIMVEKLSSPAIPLVTREVTIALSKNADGDWQIADQEAAMNALFAGADMGSLF